MRPNEIARKFIRDRNLQDREAGGYPFVTISRQPGANGEELAEEIVKRAAKRFDKRLGEGWQAFDRNICMALVEDGVLRDSLGALLAESYGSETSRFVTEMIAGHDSQFEAYKTLFETARMLAQLGKVVLVGRGAALVTAHMPMGVHIRLVATEEFRLQKLLRETKASRDEVLHQMHEHERNRARLVKDFFGRHVEDPLLYDALFVLDDLQIGEVADLVLTMVEDRVERYGRPE
jgi:cytidylate kinase